MKNVIPITRSNLDRLADQVNSCVLRSYDGLCQMASLLAEAKKECAVVGVDFKGWCLDRINLSQDYAYKLARCGERSDVLQAITELREYAKQRVEKHRQKVALRNTTPRPGTIIEIEDEEGEEEEETPPSNQLPTSMRIRGFMHRAQEAKEMAEADDMAGIETTDAMRNAAGEAAEAWIKALRNLEGN